MDTKIINSWFRYIEPNIKNSAKVVVLGFGDGDHIVEFCNRFPQIELIVVDPRKEKIVNSLHHDICSFQYMSTLEGVSNLQTILMEAKFPIPIIEYRPCWYPYKQFFNWAELTLKSINDLSKWNNTPAEFIMESLFK
jgi:hypothetical protein